MRKVIDEEARFRCGAVVGILREEVWVTENGKLARYNLAFIQHELCRVDNGRVLGYDNAHGKHERHFMGRVEEFAFDDYEQLLQRFVTEVDRLRMEATNEDKTSG